MINELTDLLNTNVTDIVKFNPEIKVKREKDTIYISELRKTKVNYMAVVEVFSSSSKNDKTPIPIGALNDVALKAIYIRLNSNPHLSKKIVY